MNIPETEWAYLAGIIDGEGCIYIHKWRDKGKYFGYTLVLHISNTDYSLIRWIRERFGGIVYTRKRRRKTKNTHSIQLLHGTANFILGKVYPYLVLKREQARVAFAFRATYKKGNAAGLNNEIIKERNRLIQEMHKLNQQGANND